MDNELPTVEQVMDTLATVAASVEALLLSLGLSQYTDGIAWLMNEEAMNELAANQMAEGLGDEAEEFLKSL